MKIDEIIIRRSRPDDSTGKDIPDAKFIKVPSKAPEIKDVDFPEIKEPADTSEPQELAPKELAKVNKKLGLLALLKQKIGALGAKPDSETPRVSDKDITGAQNLVTKTYRKIYRKKHGGRLDNEE